MPSIRFVPGDPAQIDTDLLVVPMFDGEALTSSLPALDAASAGEIPRAAAAGEIRGKLFDLFVTPARMTLVVVGDRATIEPELRKLNIGAIEFRDADGKVIAK